MTGQIKLVSLEFLTDHPPIRKNSVNSGANLMANGTVLKPPHWKSGSPRNHPVSFTRGKPVLVELTLEITNMGTFRLEGHSSSGALSFTGFCTGSVGPRRILKLKVQSNNLPGRVVRLSEKISWKAAVDPTHRVDIAETGPHEIFVLYRKV
ncbi:hypothetical protein [Tropicimonas sp. IMCC6043]|uniref:hypothetical protein n=1 Tax=Tropicimonas sp. IMCC6043 TaxID=2510645 RepID=UPI00101D96FB|nr:hypothetical protein [Tropicimonas sp. IMCC6043]RYH07213.1 hypothetical protein EU800_20830 [Tropicimonas sp. IMCC6043]